MLKQERGRDIVLSGDGDEKLQKGAGGACYESNGSGFSAAKEYGTNIVVKTQVDERQPDEEFERLGRAVRAAIAVDPSLVAPEDRLSAKLVGVAPEVHDDLTLQRAVPSSSSGARAAASPTPPASPGRATYGGCRARGS